jgi:hypothetical protein
MELLKQHAWKVFSENSVTISPWGIKAIVLFASVSILGLTGCGSQNDESNLNSMSESGSQQVGSNGQLMSIQSDNVRAAGYDAVSMVMTVQFDNGYLYEYYGVPADLWTSFIAAQPHPWSQVGYPRLVQGGIPYKRIG